ncbi:histone-lysine N-methyltransferase ASH1L-like isoform X2 [Corticium candelabrum]|uniref:histone-lysine N-methyltransferase ASH1L-like isoform X2 n=1 Tax=Corticium candelabrum TaxID=121492 RepID=UPI002E269DA6|nr:histone-lysine N-methyltransferase ASH1L-like isoform X2 [Corticium candelabrum]
MELDSRVDARDELAIVASENKNEIIKGNRLNRRSRSRSIDVDVREDDLFEGNEGTSVACSLIAISSDKGVETAAAVQKKYCCLEQPTSDRHSDCSSMADELACKTAALLKRGPQSGEWKKRKTKRLNPHPIVTKSGRVVKKTSLVEMDEEIEDQIASQPRRKRKGLASNPPTDEVDKQKVNEDILEGQDIGPPVKRYFRSGVYSESKEPTKSISVQDDSETSDASPPSYEPSAKKAKFKLKWPQPVFFGDFFMHQDRHFQLPFNIWWLLSCSKLRVRTVGAGDESSEFEYDPPIAFREIRNNIFVDIKCPPIVEHSICECKAPSEPGEMGCGDDCLNKMILTECSLKHCPCGDKCSNMHFQKHDWVQNLKKFRTKERGYGVLTTVALKMHQFIIEYCGEVISEKQYCARVLKKYKRQRHHYCLSLEGGVIIDGHNMGSKARFVNHSCEPNCEMQKWSVNGVDRMGLFALRDIAAEEELTYDYNFDPLDNEPQKCLCKSAKCRGYIGSRNGRSKRSVLLGREFIFRNPCRGRKIKLHTETKTSKNSLDKDDAKENKGNRTHGVKRKHADAEKQAFAKQLASVRHSVSDRVVPPTLAYKPMSLRERNFVIEHHIFSLKSLIQTVENFESVLKELKRVEVHRRLTSSYVRRGGRSQPFPVVASDESDSSRAEIQQQIVNICSRIFRHEDEKKENLATFLKRITANYKASAHNGLQPSIDLTTVETRLLSGEYTELHDFGADFELALQTAVDCSDSCSKAKVMKYVNELSLLYRKMRRDNESKLTFTANGTVLDEQDSEILSADDDAVDTCEMAIIRCICEMPLDEGFMVQCDRCRVWQHGDCMGYHPREEQKNAVYYCEKCSYRNVDRNIIERPQPQGGVPGCTYYLTFWHNSSLVKKGGCAYTSRDHNMSWQNGKKRSCNRTLGLKHKDQLDVFRVLGLWQDEKHERFVFGFHYFRPHEVSHSAGKRFYQNEVIQTSLYEIIPLEAVVAPCVVMDVYSYARGRPIDVNEKDVYVCELACVKSEPRLKKIPRRQVKFPFPTNPGCYQRFSQLMKLHRTVLVDAVWKQSSPKRGQIQRSPNQKAQSAKRRAAYQEKKVYGRGERVNDIALKLTEKVQRKQFLIRGKSARRSMDMDIRTEHEISAAGLQTS